MTSRAASASHDLPRAAPVRFNLKIIRAGPGDNARAGHRGGRTASRGSRKEIEGVLMRYGGPYWGGNA
ncbi:hypothetical protein GCM10009736_53300 [Actinomadura bangladeshensis]